jgi:hypothetical protein
MSVFVCGAHMRARAHTAWKAALHTMLRLHPPLPQRPLHPAPPCFYIFKAPNGVSFPVRSAMLSAHSFYNTSVPGRYRDGTGTVSR